MKVGLLIGVLGAALCLAGGGGAMAAPAPASTAPAGHHGLLSRLRHPGSRTLSGGPVGVGGLHRAAMAGAIIGNKRTHVYHLASDKGNLPAEKNRVYFHSVAEATAAGYHAAGQHAAGGAMSKHPHAAHSHRLMR